MRFSRSEQLAEVIRPLICEFLAADQRIDQLVALVGIGVVQERANLIDCRQKTCRVEVRPSDELLIACQRRMWNLVALHPPKDVFVDEILSRYGRSGRGRGGQRRSYGFREATGIFSSVLTRQ